MTATAESIEIMKLVDSFPDESIRRRFLESMRDLRDLYSGLGVAMVAPEPSPRIVSFVPRLPQPEDGPQLALPMAPTTSGTLHFLHGPRKGPKRAPRATPRTSQEEEG